MKKRRIVFPAAVLMMSVFSYSRETPGQSPATAGQAVKISGMSQLLGAVQPGSPVSLSIRRVRLVLSAEVLKNLKAKIQIDAVKTPILIDAQLDFAFSPSAGLRLGQFHVPFGLESTTSAANLCFVNPSLAVDKIAPGRDTGTQGRDIGLILTGSYSLFSYDLGYFNGPGANKAETNDEKDFAVRVGVKPFEFLRFGASYYKGRFSASSDDPAVRRDKGGVDAAVLLGPLSLKGEYLRAVDDRTRRYGWYAQADCYLLPKKLQFAARYGVFDRDAQADGDRADRVTAGLNWYLAPRTKIQANLEFAGGESSEAVKKSFFVQLQAGF